MNTSKRSKSNKSVNSAKLSLDEESTGLYDDLNEYQYETLLKFKETILKKNIMEDFSDYDNPYLLRFLRARKFDLEKTLNMFIDYLNWRKEKNVDYVMTLTLPSFTRIKSYYPTGYHGTDKIGRPIFINLLSKVNVEGLDSEDFSEIEKYTIKLFETYTQLRLPMASKAKGYLIEQGVTITDIEGNGLTFVNSIMKYIKMNASITQNFFPETLGKMYVLNSSMVFSLIWSLVSNFIDDKTKKKINVFKDDYYEKLLVDIDASNIPKFLGGECECQNEGGCMYSDKGPWNINYK